MLGLVHFRFLARPIQVILLINLVLFAFAGLGNLFHIDVLLRPFDYLVLIPSLWMQAWRLLTYAFVHVQPLHFLFNMLMFWMFADEVAKFIGDRSFVALYLLGAFFSGLLSIPFYLADLGGNAVILGASGALFSVMVAYSRLFPDRELILFLLIPMRIRYAIWVLIGIDLLLVNSGDHVAHLVHLGGAAFGFAYMALRDKASSLVETWTRPKTVVPSRKPPLAEDNDSAELDRILRKISSQGMGAVTDKERKWLEAAAERRRAKGIN